MALRSGADRAAPEDASVAEQTMVVSEVAPAAGRQAVAPAAGRRKALAAASRRGVRLRRVGRRRLRL